MRFLILALVCLCASLQMGGCSTAPEAKQQADFMSRARSTTSEFRSNVSGLSDQIRTSAGYIVFPDVAQWGIIFGGGTFGRGAVCRPDGTHIGWAAINVGSFGLQGGVQGFRLLIVLENERIMQTFMANQLSGSASGVAVLGTSGGSVASPFQNGVALYETANEGLMAGVNVGLEYLRYKPFEAEPKVYY